MADFRIRWPSGVVETHSQDGVESVEEFAKVHFGSTWDTAQCLGAKVELVMNEEEIHYGVMLGNYLDDNPDEDQAA